MSDLYLRTNQSVKCIPLFRDIHYNHSWPLVWSLRRRRKVYVLVWKHRWKNDPVLGKSRLSLQWSHNQRDGVSNHQPPYCLLTFYQGPNQRNVNAPRHWSLSPVNSPGKGPVTRKMFPFDDLIMYRFVSFPQTRLSVSKTRATILGQPNDLSCVTYTDRPSKQPTVKPIV